MEAILLLFIIAVQFALVYFGVKVLSQLNDKLVYLNEQVLVFTPKAQKQIQDFRNVLVKINKTIEGLVNTNNKWKIVRNVLLVKSLIVAIYLFKKRKSILSLFSLYNIINGFKKILMEFK